MSDFIIIIVVVIMLMINNLGRYLRTLLLEFIAQDIVTEGKLHFDMLNSGYQTDSMTDHVSHTEI